MGGFPRSPSPKLHGATLRLGDRGRLPITQLDWQVRRRLSWHVNCIDYFTGPFGKEAFHAPSSLRCFSFLPKKLPPWVTYRVWVRRHPSLYTSFDPPHANPHTATLFPPHLP